VALRVVTMAEMRLEVLLETERTGETVAEVCRRHEISRESYYRYRRRYLAEGLQGLQDRSRKPACSPGQIDPELEAEICRMRKDHRRWGARRIRAELLRKGVDPPAVSTIHQALRRNHLVALRPPRRQKANKRFEREVSNDLWQIDATRVRVATRRKVWVMDTIDDHSRLLLAAVACISPTAEAAWDCFEEASSRYGLPRQVLSDNALSFTGRLHGVEVEFERSLAELGVELINSSAAHPQTLGKLERFHRTLKEWLADEGPPEDLAHLQELLDAFRHHYNSERPHQGIGDHTPAERYGVALSTIELPVNVSFDERGQPVYPSHSIVRKVSSAGKLGYTRKDIWVGKRWAGTRVQIVPVGDIVHIYWGQELLRAVVVNPDRRYQPMERRVRKAQAVT
jgi:transposase InsO family protein